MQPFTYETEMERSRAGRAHLYTTIAQSATRPRKKQGGWLTEQGWDALLILGFAGGFGLYLVVKIAAGLPAILARHGIL